MTQSFVQFGPFMGDIPLMGMGLPAGNAGTFSPAGAIDPFGLAPSEDFIPPSGLVAMDGGENRLPDIESRYSSHPGSDPQNEIANRWHMGFHRSFLAQEVAERKAQIGANGYETRRLRGIRETVDRLSAILEGADRELIISFARGHKALAAYERLLSNEGLALLKIVDGAINDPSITVERINELLPSLPSVADPKLSLYRNPFSDEARGSPEFAAFRELINSLHSKALSFIQVAAGCRNGCLMCAENAERKNVRFMPLPIVLLLVRDLIDKDGYGDLAFYLDNDVLQWRDENFDADFGDLMRGVKDMGVPLTRQVTHGFWPGDQYAEPAAKKCRELGMYFTLSFHLFHNDVFRAPGLPPDPAMLRRYAHRFANVIELLQPGCVSMISNWTSPNDYLSWRFLMEFYDDWVFPLLSDELNARYPKLVLVSDMGADPAPRMNNKYSVEIAPVRSEGRANNSPFFSFGGTDSDDETIHGEGLELFVSASGRVTLKHTTSTKSRDALRTFRNLTVGAAFPDPDADEFRFFYMNVLFDLSRSSMSPNIIYWLRTIPDFKAQCSSYKSSDPEGRRKMHAALRDAPLFDANLLSSPPETSQTQYFVDMPFRADTGVSP